MNGVSLLASLENNSNERVVSRYGLNKEGFGSRERHGGGSGRERGGAD